MRILLLITGAVGLIILALLPQVIPPYYVGLLIKVLIFAMFAMSLDLLMGYLGLPSLGHAAFLGVASYGVGIWSLRVGNDFTLALGFGLALSLVTAAVFGVMVLRSRGPQFLMLTLALSQVLWGIAFKWKPMTGGDDGMPGIPRPILGISWDLSVTSNYFYFTLAFFIVAAVLMFLITRSPFGHSLEGIREAETRMRALGYNIWLHQYIAFLIAGLFAGLAGVLLAYYNGFVSPTELNVVTSAKVFLMVVLGGGGTLIGPFLGAAIIVLLENVISGYTERWLSIMGLLYVAVVLFAPTGIYGFIRERVRGWIPL
ncbi:MAG: branched-chain amino acid ABC transporter permease [Dehalococcoidia bacterium]|nr:branched-chain amino acid ABC transporter permease [Dehalococcoidia bacterium]